MDVDPEPTITTPGADGVVPCRAAVGDDEDAHPSILAFVVVLFVGSYWVTVTYLGSVRAVDELVNVDAELGLWIALLGVLTGYGVAGGLVAVRRLSVLRRLFVTVSQASVLRWALSVVLIVGSLVASLFWSGEAASIETIGERLARDTRPITIAVSIASVPGLTGFLMIRSIAAHGVNWNERGACQVMLVTRLQRELQRTLATFAVLLTLIVVATGMRRRALLAHDEELSIPIEQVVLYGLVFAALLGALYGVAKTAIDHRAAALVERYAALPDPRDPRFGEVLKRRTELQQVLSLGHGTRQTFESTVTIAAPLVTALIGSALG